MSDKLRELRGQLDERRNALAAIFAEAKVGTDEANGNPIYDLTKATALTGDSAARVDQVRKLNDEMESLQSQVTAEQDDQASLADIASGVEGMGEIVRPGIHAPQGGRQIETAKSLGDLFTASKAFKDYQPGSTGGPVASFDVDLRSALFSTGGGWAPESLRTGHVEYFATRPAPAVINLFPEYTTAQAAVKYMEETTFTNAAAETAEGGAYNQATLVLTERSQTVRKVTVWLPVTDEQLEDVGEASAYLNNRLPFMLQQKVDGQALLGDGIAPNLLGTENVAGIQTQALGADPIFDAAFKLFRKIRDNGFAEPNAFVIAPSKWETVALTRTADGLYILGNPASDIPTRLWGVPGLQSVAGTSTKLTAGDYRNFSGVYVRRGIDVQIGYNNDDFTKGQLSIRADVRIAIVHFRPKAFGTVTGL